MVKNSPLFEIHHCDRDGNPLRVGDRVGFTMRGWYLPREQETFGLIKEIDSRGGIRIEAIENYKHFTSSGRLASRETEVYFVHHIYDPRIKTRIYYKEFNGYTHSVYRVDPDMKRPTETKSEGDTDPSTPVE